MGEVDATASALVPGYRIANAFLRATNDSTANRGVRPRTSQLEASDLADPHNRQQDHREQRDKNPDDDKQFDKAETLVACRLATSLDVVHVS